MATSDVSPPKIRAAHHSLSGCRHGQQPVHSLLARADAAHQAGITEIGACASDLGSWDPAELAHLVRQHRVTVRELEWLELGEPDHQAERDLYRLADIFGATQLNVGVSTARMYPEAYLAAELARIGREAAAHNLKVAFEPVVFGSVPGIADVQRIIEKSRSPHAGTLLDTYHLARTARWDSLDGVWPELVRGVQISGINQVEESPSWPYGLLREAQCGRLLPDEGEFPVGDWLQALLDKGVEARLSVEVLSDEQRALSVFDAADRIAGSSAKFFSMWEAMS
jgi:sugar phosphate isomerase/epimerase